MMTRICAWCKTVLGSTDGAETVTHGICEPCAARMEAEAAQYWKEQRGMKKFKPHDLATTQLPVSDRPRVVEIISYPTPEGTVMVRMVPGEPTSMTEVKNEDEEGDDAKNP